MTAPAYNTERLARDAAIRLRAIMRAPGGNAMCNPRGLPALARRLSLPTSCLATFANKDELSSKINLAELAPHLNLNLAAYPVATPERAACQRPKKLIKKYRAKQKKRYKAKRKKGICPTCSASAAPGHVYCQQHIAQSKQQYAEAKNDNTCVLCVRVDACEGHSMCKQCRDLINTKSTARRASLRASGLCTNCGDTMGADRIGKHWCANCASAESQRQKARRANPEMIDGKPECKRCRKRPAQDGKTKCAQCGELCRQYARGKRARAKAV